MSLLAHLDWLLLPATIITFLLAQQLQKRLHHPLANALLWSMLLWVAILLVSGISFTRYFEVTHWLSDLLQPAVVALGVPLFRQLKAMRRHLPVLIGTTLLSSFCGLLTAVGLGLLFGLEPQLVAAFAPRSVTTPVAVEIAISLQAPLPLAALAVIVTGLFGAIFGLPLLQWLGIKDKRAQGVAMGAASHALGTARCAEVSPVLAAYSALAMVLCALFTTLLAPYLVPWLIRLGS